MYLLPGWGGTPPQGYSPAGKTNRPQVGNTLKEQIRSQSYWLDGVVKRTLILSPLSSRGRTVYQPTGTIKVVLQLDIPNCLNDSFSGIFPTPTGIYESICKSGLRGAPRPDLLTTGP